MIKPNSILPRICAPATDPQLFVPWPRGLFQSASRSAAEHAPPTDPQVPRGHFLQCKIWWMRFCLQSWMRFCLMPLINKLHAYIWTDNLLLIKNNSYASNWILALRKLPLLCPRAHTLEPLLLVEGRVNYLSSVHVLTHLNH